MGKKISHKVWLPKILIILVALVTLGFLIYPLYPALQYELGFIGDQNYELVTLKTSQDRQVNTEDIPGDNTLVIPKIGVNIKIVEGADESALNKGAWRIPKTSTPDMGGNTVISGHRYKYRPPSSETFYLLDKLELGDQFTVYWAGKRYDYSVSETKVVEKTAVEIQDNTEDSQVTLFTCTPLFTTLKRLVVVGQLID